MPVISSQFDPPWPLRNGHLQTILPAILRWRTNVAYQRERLELDDGDFLDLDWLPSGSRRLAVLSHGLEGSSRDAVMRGMAAALAPGGMGCACVELSGLQRRDEPAAPAVS